jgi:DNA modification methylase
MINSLRPNYTVLQGNIRDLFDQIGEVDCVVTSVPYYKQRQYGASPSEMGWEKDVDAYIQGLVEVFTSIRLHQQGSIWVNIADKRIGGSLLAIPARFGLRMIDAGFKLCDDVIWAKSAVRDDGSSVGHCMTEPCKTRLNGNGHEAFFRFTKSKEAWTDTVAVNIPRSNVETVRYLPADLMSCETSINGRSLHNVWITTMGQTSERHYAVYPTTLVERPIAMSCPPFVNPDGSMPRRRVEWIEYDERRGGGRRIGKNDPLSSVEKKGRHDTGRRYIPRMPVSLGWETIVEGARLGVVLDPFMGTGTTGAVALKLGRSFVGVDLYPEYAEIAQRRCEDAVRFVDASYGYEQVYKMITRDQHDLKAKLEGGRLHQALRPERSSVFHDDEIFSFA